VSSMVITNTFPTASIAATADRLPIEVVLISQLGHGAGTQLIQASKNRQAAHTTYIDDLDEPSAKLGGTDFKRGDATSLYSFSVGANGHPFHRHVGHRIFTAISGSSGAQLRFSVATDKQIAGNPTAFFNDMHLVNIPADCLFTVRFPGGVWHQFVPLAAHTVHPALFAISCHSNELSGIDDTALRQTVIDNNASIPGLTILLPDAISALVTPETLSAHHVPLTTLSFNAPSDSLLHTFCNKFRAIAGALRSNCARLAGQGFSKTEISYAVTRRQIPADSLLNRQFAEEACEHEDCFSIDIKAEDIPPNATSSQLLVQLLEAFISQPASGVTALMLTRNILVKPFGLRTSPLGCPVSSLLSDNQACLFAQRFPVIEQYINNEDNYAEVVLGADDKHLRFRSSVAVSLLSNGCVRFSLATKVKCKNAFGRFYMAMIQKVHLRYVVPTMLEQAVAVLIATPLELASTATESDRQMSHHLPT